jgi:hypothetical protein
MTKDEAWEMIDSALDHSYSEKDVMEIKEVLAQPAFVQEPVAWMRPSEEGYDSAFRDHSTVVACIGNPWTGWAPLYTTPPAQPAQEPIYQMQMMDGKWIDQAKQSYESNKTHGYTMRIVYITPPAAAKEENT